MDQIIKSSYTIYYKKKLISPKVHSPQSLSYHFGKSPHSGVIKIAPVFPGVDFLFLNFSMNTCDCTIHTSKKLFKIEYGLSGRKECNWKPRQSIFLGENDLCLSYLEQNDSPFYFPLGHYCGFIILIDFSILKKEKDSLSEFEKTCLFTFYNTFSKKRFFATHVEEPLTILFASLHTPHIQFNKTKKAILTQSFLAMSKLNKKQKQLNHTTKKQLETILKIQQKLTENLKYNLTIDEICKDFEISKTSLKNGFKTIYNMPVKNYFRHIKIQYGAQQLLTSSQTITEISNSLGFTSSSKFTTTFKSYYGLTPLEYRRKYIQTNFN